MDAGLAVVFAGTPEFALPSLDAIAASRHRIRAVLTQPDRPSGRGRHVAPSPVKERALELGLPVAQPGSLKDGDAARGIAALAPDVMVVVAYGLLLPPEVLALPRLGCLNVHASLLPRWRGAAPVARAILAGDGETGVCIMRMDAGLDTGPVMLARATPIGARETAGELEARLAAMGGELIVEALDALAEGRAAFAAQDTAGATYAQKLTKAEARLDWREDVASLLRRVRALNPRPVAETTLDGMQLRIHEAEAVTAPPGPVPGTIASAGADGIVVIAGDGAIALTRVQLPGRRAVAARELANARPLVGKVLV
ncbi:MAG TPA: methionyl-tRNA formyltransferase, partial [Steroidobacteraceae bacterium]|nr:methionyl-tRNA formyltransferase [Steroidobacteraceae bacterium]